MHENKHNYILAILPLFMASIGKFRSKITFKSIDKAVLVLEIPQEVLINWHNLKRKGHDLLYADFLNSSGVLPSKVLQHSCLEKRIADVAWFAKKQCHEKSGRKKQELLKKKQCVRVWEMDIDRIGVAKEHPDVQAVEQKESLAYEELEQRCSEMVSEISRVRETLQNTDARLERCETEKNLLKEQNATLTSQIKQLEDLNVCCNCNLMYANQSKPLNDVGIRQRQRKIKELKTNAETALWFLESYGVTLTRICVEDSRGKQVDISPGVTKAEKGSNYQNLMEEEKTQIKEVLCILDRFCVGDAAYHALCEEENGLPRSYMVKQCRADINSSFVITRTQGDLVGAQMSFKEELKRKLKEKVFLMTGQIMMMTLCTCI